MHKIETLLIAISLTLFAGVAFGQDYYELPQPAFEQQDYDLPEILTIEKLDEMSKSSGWQERFYAAKFSLSIPDFDTIAISKLFVESINREILHPSSLEFSLNSYATNSERVLRQYVFNLVELGPSITSLLYSYLDSLSGDVRNWIIIVLGFDKQQSVHEELRLLLLNNPNPNLRSMAARALSQYADSSDIEVFKKALSDPHKITYQSDHITETQGNTRTVYPVHSEAAAALREMGYVITVDSSGVFTIKGK